MFGRRKADRFGLFLGDFQFWADNNSVILCILYDVYCGFIVFFEVFFFLFGLSAQFAG